MEEELSIHPTADWQPLYDVSYRRVEVVKEMSWDVDLEKMKACGAQYGGPLAVRRDEKQSADDSSRPSVRVFSGGSGKQLSTIMWEGRSAVAGFGWTVNEHLALVLEDGSVEVYTMHGDMVASFSLGEAVREQRVAEVQVWGRGLVVLTRRHQFCSVEDLEDPYPEMLEDPRLRGPPTCWAVIRPQFTGHGGVEVLVGTPEGSLLVVEMDRASDMQLSNGPFLLLSVSPNGRMVCTYSATGSVWVYSSDFSQNYTEFNTRNKVPPAQLVWCGSDAVACYWPKPNVLFLMGPYGDWLKYDYDAPVFLVGELDGVRVVGAACEFVQRVPNVTEDIFKIASTSASAKLYDANEHYRRKSPRADDLIRSLRENKELESAVESCIEAASQEWNPVLQRLLLQAASFGKCFLSGYDPSNFLLTCRELRVLNALREARVGIPLSYRQFMELTSTVLVDRLIARNEHYLAWKICEWLKIKGHRVLVQWACTKVKGPGEEHEITQSIVQKLQSVSGISYAEIASTAYKHGRPQLATRLLDFEPRAADQVPLLINMRQPGMALQKAVDSGDTDLIYLVLLHLRRVHAEQPSAFLALVKDKPQAMQLLIKYAWFQDRPLLKQLFTEIEAPERQGDFMCWKALRAKNTERRVQVLSSAHELYGSARSAAFEKEVTGQHVKLLRWQMDLEDSGGEGYVNLSLGQTLHKLLEEGDEKKAAKLAKDFRVSDARFWWTKIRALVNTRRFDDLSNFAAANKKSPIGWTPFVDVCVEADAKDEAVQYVGRIPERHIQAQFYMMLEQYREAADAAAELGDPNALQQILARCQTAADKRHVQGLLDQF